MGELVFVRLEQHIIALVLTYTASIGGCDQITPQRYLHGHGLHRCRHLCNVERTGEMR
jgi:hypothetical protein